MLRENNNVSGADIKIIGFGNIFMSDDSIGIKIIEEMRKIDFFSSLDLIDGGTSGIDLIFYLKESDKVIVVDAVDAGQKTAEVIKITPNNISDYSTDVFKSYSLHNLGLKDVIELAKKLGLDKKMFIVGIKPKKIDYGETLSLEIKEKIPEIIETIKSLL